MPDGLLLVDKPAGMTSHDVVGVARRSLRERRIGHAGTLDPFATGLLVLLVGRATRLLPYLDGEPKEYAATIRFGAETDTEDHLGRVTVSAPLPAANAVGAAVMSLTGTLTQVPPAFSAKRVGGVRAYDLARAGADVTLRPATVRVFGWTLMGWRGEELDAVVSCGGGTYVRSLARDLGRMVGSAAHLTALRRLRSGPFRVSEAQSVEELGASPVVRPALEAVGSLPRQALDEAEVAKIVRGIDVPATVPGDRGALVGGTTGTLIAVAERQADRWQPRVVMREC